MQGGGPWAGTWGGVSAALGGGPADRRKLNLGRGKITSEQAGEVPLSFSFLLTSSSVSVLLAVSGITSPLLVYGASFCMCHHM